MLSHWAAAIFRACNSGVPELTSVESWWKKVSVSSSFAALCGLLRDPRMCDDPFLERHISTSFSLIARSNLRLTAVASRRATRL